MLQTYKVGNKGINVNFVFPYICSFLHYLHHVMLIDLIVKLDVSWQKGSPFKVSDFISPFNFEWHRQNKVGNIGIHVLWRDHGKL